MRRKKADEEQRTEAKGEVKGHVETISQHVRALHRMERRIDADDLLTRAGWEKHSDDCNKIKMIVDRIRRRFE
jgi:hypothetical protein